MAKKLPPPHQKRDPAESDAEELRRLISEPGSGRFSPGFVKRLLSVQREKRMRGLASKYAPAVREPVTAVLAADTLEERLEAVDALARVRGGAPADEARQRQALEAYRRERKNGAKVEAAIAAAMKAGDFTRSYVYELRKKQKWDEPP